MFVIMKIYDGMYAQLKWGYGARWMDLEMHKIPEIRPIILILPSLWVKSSPAGNMESFGRNMNPVSQDM